MRNIDIGKGDIDPHLLCTVIYICIWADLSRTDGCCFDFICFCILLLAMVNLFVLALVFAFLHILSRLCNFGCHYQCSQNTGKTRLWNDVELDVSSDSLWTVIFNSSVYDTRQLYIMDMSLFLHPVMNSCIGPMLINAMIGTLCEYFGIKKYIGCCCISVTLSQLIWCHVSVLLLWPPCFLLEIIVETVVNCRRVRYCQLPAADVWALQVSWVLLSTHIFVVSHARYFAPTGYDNQEFLKSNVKYLFTICTYVDVEYVYSDLLLLYRFFI